MIVRFNYSQYNKKNKHFIKDYTMERLLISQNKHWIEPYKNLIQEYLNKSISKASIAKLLDVHLQTLYSFIKKILLKSDSK